MRRWEALGDVDGAMRCVRKLGDLCEVERVARGLGADDLDHIAWAVAILNLLDNPPDGGAGLDPSDEALVRQAIDNAFPGKRPKKKPKKRSR